MKEKRIEIQTFGEIYELDPIKKDCHPVMRMIPEHITNKFCTIYI